jgi:hypothetical protein
MKKREKRNDSYNINNKILVYACKNYSFQNLHSSHFLYLKKVTTDFININKIQRDSLENKKDLFENKKVIIEKIEELDYIISKETKKLMVIENDNINADDILVINNENFYKEKEKEIIKFDEKEKKL